MILYLESTTGYVFLLTKFTTTIFIKTFFFLEMGHPSSRSTLEGARGRILEWILHLHPVQYRFDLLVKLSSGVLRNFWTQKLYEATTFIAQT